MEKRFFALAAIILLSASVFVPAVDAKASLLLGWVLNPLTRSIANNPFYNRVNINDTLCLWNTTYSTWFCLNGSWSGSVNVSIFTGYFLNLTDAPHSYVAQAHKCVSVNGGESGLEFVNCSTGGGSGVLNKTYFVGLTTLSFDGNLGGYQGGDVKCRVDFVDSHMCQEFEVIQTIQDLGFASFPNPNWAWASTAGSKYATGASPADDCAGWTDNSDNHQGSFWVFDNVTGGYGAMVGCGSIVHPLACCR